MRLKEMNKDHAFKAKANEKVSNHQIKGWNKGKQTQSD